MTKQTIKLKLLLYPVSSFEVTDKGTPGVILGRKAKAFAILDFDFQFWIEKARTSLIQNLKSEIKKDVWLPK